MAKAKFKIGDLVRLKHRLGNKHKFVNRHRARRIIKVTYNAKQHHSIYYLGTNHRGNADNLSQVGFRNSQLKYINEPNKIGRPKRREKRTIYIESTTDQHESARRKWRMASQETKDMWVTKIIQGNHRKQSKTEIHFFNMLQANFPNEWEFVGNGQVILDGLNPDFININGQKKIIELFGSYWHSQKMTNKTPHNEENKRKRCYAKFGYSTLIIWENDFLKDPIKTATRVKEFIAK